MNHVCFHVTNIIPTVKYTCKVNLKYLQKFESLEYSSFLNFCKTKPRVVDGFSFSVAARTALIQNPIIAFQFK